MVQVSTVFGPPYHVACWRATKTELFRRLFNHVFRVRNFGNTSAMRVIFFSRIFKIWSRFQNCRKKWRMPFVSRKITSKLSLLRKIHLSLAVNMLTNILKTLHITKTDFFNSIAFTVINKYKKVGAVQISTVFCRTYHVACPRVLWNGIF